jgi:hypothetical protein
VEILLDNLIVEVKDLTEGTYTMRIAVALDEPVCRDARQIIEQFEVSYPQ